MKILNSLGWARLLCPRSIFLLISTFGLCGMAAAAQNVASAWAARYAPAGSYWDAGRNIAVDANGNVIVVGVSTGPDGSSDITTLKYTASGTLSWSAQYSGSGANSSGLARAVTLDTSGNIYVTGKVYNGSDYDMVTIKYDPNGQRLWATLYNNGSGMEDDPIAITLDSVGNVYIAGRSSTVSGLLDYAYTTIKYSPSGQQLWVAHYDGDIHNDEAAALAVDASGNVYVTGRTCKTRSDAIVCSYDYATLKYDSSGRQLWLARYGDLWSDEATDLAVDSNGNVYVTGATVDPVSGYVAFGTIKYDTNGAQAWANFLTGVVGMSMGNSINPRYGDGGLPFESVPLLALDSSANVYLVGLSFMTVKYDTAGQLVWVNTGVSQGGVTGLALDAHANVYLTGNGQVAMTGIASTDFCCMDNDYLTVKLDSNGVQAWSIRYDNGGQDYVDRAIAVDGSGSVYVTGTSCDGGSCTGYDIATVKYLQGTFALLPPDLTVGSVSGPATGAGGKSITIKTTACNRGNGTAGSFAVGLYLSTDATVTTADTRLGQANVLNLAVGTCNTFSTSVTLPRSAKGSYSLGAIADYTNAVVEGREDNNAKVGNTIQVK